MSEMIERVARAIYYGTNPKKGWDVRSDEFRQKWRDMARAAIEAMRSPTTSMIIAGDEAGGGAGKSSVTPVTDGVWFAMINAALSTPNTDKT